MRDGTRCWCLLLWLMPTVLIADWPGIQGPAWNGHSTEEILPNWPTTGPELLWAYTMGQGYSSVAVHGDWCVTQTQDTLSQYIVGLRVQDGAEMWKHRCGSPYEAFGVYPGPRSTPTIQGNLVYFTTPAGLVGCLELQTGHPKWSQQIITDEEAQGVGFGYAASPLVLSGLVLVPCGGAGTSVLALDANTGNIVWQAGTGPASYCPIQPIELEGETLLVAYLQNAQMILNLRGEILWEQQISIGYDEHATLPVYAEPWLVFAAPFRAGATAFRLQWAKSASGERTLQVDAGWSQLQFSNDVTSCVTQRGLLFGFDLRDAQSKAHRPSRGEFRCLDIETGDVLWSHPEIGQAGIIALDQRLLLFNDRGEILLADVSREGGQIVSRAQVFRDEVCWTRPALADGRLYVRGREQLVCLRVSADAAARAGTGPRKYLADLPAPRRVSWNWLINGEREHPLMPPERTELLLWYFAGLIGVVLPALLLSKISYGWRTIQPQDHVARSCWLMALLALLTTPLFNQFFNQFHTLGSNLGTDFCFTWPAGLFGLLQGTVLASCRASQDRNNKSHYWQARAWGCVWLLVSLGYYIALRSSSLPLQWVFLVGYLPALAVTVWTARLTLRAANSWLVVFSLLLGYSTLFWTATAFEMLRLG